MRTGYCTCRRVQFRAGLLYNSRRVHVYVRAAGYTPGVRVAAYMLSVRAAACISRVRLRYTARPVHTHARAAG